MAFDGITIANITSELNKNLVGCRIYKIAQPEQDELILTIKGNSTQCRLLLSADASLPLVYLTDVNKPSPLNAPNFCMLLRKHIQNARIISVTQPAFERIIRIELEHLNEMGDLCRKYLIVEIMGKHSNIIFCDEKGMIIDSIKHISGMVSSVREVLPGREYFVPNTSDKSNPLTCDEACFKQSLSTKSVSIAKAIYTSFNGISPLIAQELCYRAGVDGDYSVASLEENSYQRLWEEFAALMGQIAKEEFEPSIYYKEEEPVEYASVPLTVYDMHEKKDYESVSLLLQDYYAKKSVVTRIRQRSVDLRKIVATALERNVKKYDLQLKQLEDSKKREKYKLYGELLNAYGYQLPTGEKKVSVLNYYTNEMTEIPLEEELSPLENAKKYFDKYSKLKRTATALEALTSQTKEEIEHLESVQAALDIALKEEDLVQIKEELIETGYIKRKGVKKKEKITSKPFCYISSDGYKIYVGKNNYQNDELTFNFATGNDWWFHAKGMPGSHVIVKCQEEEMPDRTFEEAAKLAAYYSKGRGQDKIEIDYTRKKNVKKPGGAKPGFVVYYTNYSMMIDSDIRGIKEG
ncbi:MAG: NFACT family protein [Lachnospiraceae bacterium]|nr:NFACT family protein [Lachnospiraceae bacterium]